LFQEQLLKMAMTVAGFSGGEAEELRRAMGFKRSEKRMREIEAKLRAGMTRNGISHQAQEEIVLSITSFALYGFPESHAASFALLAYASAYLKCHYLAAFTAALLNNQPMGFYRPATIVKDAQRHGLKVLPVDVTRSQWNCTIETVSGFEFQVSSVKQLQIPRFARNDKPEGEWNDRKSDQCDHLSPCHSEERSDEESAVNSKPETRNSKLSFALRLGLRYARGLREEAGQAIGRARNIAPFTSVRDLVHRVPELRKDELNTLAAIGALNTVSSFEFQGSSEDVQQHACYSEERSDEESAVNWKPETRNLKFHRRDALWQVERAVRNSGPLIDDLPEPDSKSPLQPMNVEERLVADFRGTGMTVGPHPMAYHRPRLDRMRIHKAVELCNIPTGRRLRIGGCVIARQRPGTAKGFVFLSLEDETGVANAIVNPDLFQQNRLLLSSEQFLMVDGILQNQDNVISVKAIRVEPLHVTRAQTSSHDFY